MTARRIGIGISTLIDTIKIKVDTCVDLVETVSADTHLFRKNLGLRIEQCVKIIGKKGESATIVGVTPEQLNKWINGTVKVPVEALRLLAAAANSDFSWLATGQGAPGHDRPIQIRRTGASSDDGGRATGLDQPSFVRLPVYSEVLASAGPGAVPVSEQANNVVAFDRIFLRNQGGNPDRCSIIFARGTSMKPTIPDGAILVVDHSQRDVAHGCIYVFTVGDQLLVKRARWRMDGKLELVSDNTAEDYPIETFGPDAVDDLRVVGRVVYFCRTP